MKRSEIAVVIATVLAIEMWIEIGQMTVTAAMVVAVAERAVVPKQEQDAELRSYCSNLRS